MKTHTQREIERTIAAALSMIQSTNFINATYVPAFNDTVSEKMRPAVVISVKEMTRQDQPDNDMLLTLKQKYQSPAGNGEAQPATPKEPTEEETKAAEKERQKRVIEGKARQELKSTLFSTMLRLVKEGHKHQRPLLSAEIKTMPRNFDGGETQKFVIYLDHPNVSVRDKQVVDEFGAFAGKLKSEIDKTLLQNGIKLEEFPNTLSLGTLAFSPEETTDDVTPLIRKPSLSTPSYNGR